MSNTAVVVLPLHSYGCGHNAPHPIHTYISVELLLKLGTKYWAVEKAREGGSKSLSDLIERARCTFSRLPGKVQA